jgi:hypothetical protein
MSGGDAVFKARVARMANKLGIALADPDLKALQAQYKAAAVHLIALQPLLEQPAVYAPATTAASLKSLLLARDPTADIQHAITHSKPYSGNIVAEDDRFFAQSTGKGMFIIHDKKLLENRNISVDASTVIIYQSGRATLMTRRQRRLGKEH